MTGGRGGVIISRGTETLLSVRRPHVSRDSRRHFWGKIAAGIHNNRVVVVLGWRKSLKSVTPTPQPPSAPTPQNLPPIWPLEQARGVRGRVVDGSLGVAEVVVGAAESVGRLTQEKGAHRPGGGRNGPGWEDVGGTPLRLSHVRF